RFSHRFREVLDSRVEAAVAEARMEAKIEMYYGIIAEGATLLVLWAGGWQVISRSLTLGEFVAFHAYVLMLLGPMFDIGRLIVAGRRAQGTAERIIEMRQHPPEVMQPVNPRLPVPAELKLENVTFAYGNRTVLKDVTMGFPQGRNVGIAGTVGSGKSTVFRLLLRLADPVQGRVTLGGVDIREFDIAAYRRLFGYAPQEPMLFSDTIRNNILFGRSGVGDEALARLLTETELADEIAGFEKGLDELLGERGTRLSGGQRGRVAIARALLGSPAFLLLDDAMSALDAETEQRLVRRLLNTGNSRTLVVASHRLSVLAACDWIYVLDAGRLEEEGSHFELLARHGLYWRLYQRQLLKEELERL
ncbi:MAG: ABC transporter ATP-binding protein, partial [candidate division WOR-3 bacterium]